MKATFLKSILPPLFMFILYVNLDQFIFNFEAKANYLQKRLKKLNGEISDKEKELKSIMSDTKNKTYEELSHLLQDFQEVKNHSENNFFEVFNIYEVFKNHELVLLSEQSTKGKASRNSELVNITNFTLTGSFSNIIKTLQRIAESELVPVHFTLVASLSEETKYSISVWNQR